MNDEQIIDSVAPAVIAWILPILRETMETCVERHAIGEGRGADGFSFGTDAWSFPKRVFLDRQEEDEEFPFRVTVADGCVLHFGDVRLRHHRVGQSEEESIDTARPGNARALRRESQQLELFARDEGGARKYPCIAIAYMANPMQGLCALYLCTVGRINERGQIESWAYSRLLWSRNDFVASENLDALPVEVVAPTVTRELANPSRDAEVKRETESQPAEKARAEQIEEPTVKRESKTEPRADDEDR